MAFGDKDNTGGKYADGGLVPPGPGLLGAERQGLAAIAEIVTFTLEFWAGGGQGQTV